MTGNRLEILQVGHPILRQPSRPVDPGEIANPAVQTFIDELVVTMRAAHGAGLAANQVGRLQQICAIEVDHNPRYPYKPPIPLTILVNPVLTPLSDDLFENNEGCLSVPNLRGNVRRYTELRVQALDRHGRELDCVVVGLSAGTFQHECDHLAGKLFLDRVTDPTTFATWDGFVRYQRDDYLRRVTELVARYGS